MKVVNLIFSIALSSSLLVSPIALADLVLMDELELGNATGEGLGFALEDFVLSTIDIVQDPSAPGAFVNGIMEGKEWVWDNGVLKEAEIEAMHRTIQRASRRELEETQIRAFKKFMSKL